MKKQLSAYLFILFSVTQLIGAQPTRLETLRKNVVQTVHNVNNGARKVMQEHPLVCGGSCLAVILGYGLIRKNKRNLHRMWQNCWESVSDDEQDSSAAVELNPPLPEKNADITEADLVRAAKARKSREVIRCINSLGDDAPLLLKRVFPQLYLLQKDADGEEYFDLTDRNIDAEAQLLIRECATLDACASQK